MTTALQTTTDTALVPADVTPLDLQTALAGDLQRLTPEGRLKFYGALCQTTGLNPLTKPFDWLTFQGKLVLYANKGCAEQLRKIHGVSIDIVERKMEFGCLIVRVKATSNDGRHDEAVGAVPFSDGMAPDAKANAVMKVETKAKRRVTLSICGLGLLDESELDTVRDHSAVVTALNGEESAAARADKLNAALTETEKAKSIDADVVPAEPVAAATQPASSEPPASRESEVKEPAAVPAAQPESKPAAPTTPGVLDEETVRNLEIVLSECGVGPAMNFLVARRKIQVGQPLNMLIPDAAEFILTKTKQFKKMVEEFKKGSSK